MDPVYVGMIIINGMGEPTPKGKDTTEAQPQRVSQFNIFQRSFPVPEGKKGLIQALLNPILSLFFYFGSDRGAVW